MPAAAACSAVERPISPPVAVTYEFKAMFCALNGAVRQPCRANMRHKAVTVILLPTYEPVPCTMIGLPGMRVSSLKALEEVWAQHRWRRFDVSGGTTGTAPLDQRFDSAHAGFN